MARTSKGFAYRPTREAGKKSRFYWAWYREADGHEKNDGLKLSDGDGVTDKSVAEELLRQILNRVERESAGLIDQMVEAASKPIRSLIAGYIRHLRRERYTRTHRARPVCTPSPPQATARASGPCSVCMPTPSPWSRP